MDTPKKEMIDLLKNTTKSVSTGEIAHNCRPANGTVNGNAIQVTGEAVHCPGQTNGLQAIHVGQMSACAVAVRRRAVTAERRALRC